MAQFDKEASQTRDYWAAKCATHRAARLDPSRRKERLLGMTIKNHLRWGFFAPVADAGEFEDGAEIAPVSCQGSGDRGFGLLD